MTGSALLTVRKSAFQADNTGSIPVPTTNLFERYRRTNHGALAERRFRASVKRDVFGHIGGSIPSRTTTTTTA